MHELIISRSRTLEVVWYFPHIVTKSFLTLKVIVISWVAWVGVLLIPFGGGIVFIDFEIGV